MTVGQLTTISRKDTHTDLEINALDASLEDRHEYIRGLQHRVQALENMANAAGGNVASTSG